MFIYIQPLSATKDNFLLKEYLLLLTCPTILIIICILLLFLFYFNFYFSSLLYFITLNNSYCPILLYLLY